VHPVLPLATPMFSYVTSKFCKFHVNQELLQKRGLMSRSGRGALGVLYGFVLDSHNAQTDKKLKNEKLRSSDRHKSSIENETR